MSLKQIHTLESNLEITNKDIKLLNEKVEENFQNSAKYFTIKIQEIDDKNEEVQKLFINEMSEKENSLKSFCKGELDLLAEKIEKNYSKLSNQNSNISNDITNIRQSANSTENEIIALKEDLAILNKSVEVSNSKFEHFQELNNAVINNVKQSMKNAESQIAIHERDQKNQLTFLENKLNQKVFTQETMQKFESRFLATELSANNIRNEIENIISKFNLISPKAEPSNAISGKSRGGVKG